MTTSTNQTITPADEMPALPGRYEMKTVKELAANPLNIREDAQALPEIVDNLRTDGVAGMIAPIVVITDPDGGYLIIDGEQRFKSALDAGVTHVQVLIRDDLADRVNQDATMLRTTIRTDPGAHALARGIARLTLAGLSDADIARKTGWKRDKVTAAKAVANLPKEVAADSRTLALDMFQNATLEEFADDPETQEELLDAATSLEFERVTVAARKKRAKTARLQDRCKELVTAGIAATTGFYSTNANPDSLAVRELTHDGKRLTAEAHATCPGHMINVDTRWDDAISETAYCTAWKTHGHLKTGHDGKPVGGKMTDAQKDERRTVVQNRKDMETANEVRRAWAARLLAGSGIKGAEKFIASTITVGGHFLSSWISGGRAGLDQMLGRTKTPRTGYVSQRASAEECVKITLASMLAAYEESVTKDAWRRPTDAAVTLLRFYVANGYQLAAVEQLVLDTDDARKKQEAARDAKRKATAAKSATKPATRTTASTPQPTPAPVATGGTVDQAATPIPGSATEPAAVAEPVATPPALAYAA